MILENITIQGDPISWQRAARCGKKTYDKQKSDKMNVQWNAKIQMKGICLASKPLKIDFRFYVLPTKKSRLKRKEMGFSQIHRIRDIDNFIKFYFDALNKVLWDDDSLIYGLTANKIYSEEPRTEIIVSDIEFKNLLAQKKGND